MTTPPRVLVVDDEENLRLLYEDELQLEGYEVKTVADAETALKIIERDPPDAVVMDIRMPRMDGIEAMGRMLSRKNDLPVILNSAYTSYQDDFRSWPADAYVIKSADLGELKQVLRKIIKPARARV